MSFVDDLNRFTIHLETKSQAVFVGVVAEVKNSIVFGSALTGAPGQVVADVFGGELRASWQIHDLGPMVAEISTDVPWAEQNEDGIARPGGGPYIQRAAVGGRWNVALTLAGAQRIVDSVTRELA